MSTKWKIILIFFLITVVWLGLMYAIVKAEDCPPKDFTGTAIPMIDKNGVDRVHLLATYALLIGLPTNYIGVCTVLPEDSETVDKEIIEDVEEPEDYQTEAQALAAGGVAGLIAWYMRKRNKNRNNS